MSNWLSDVGPFTTFAHCRARGSNRKKTEELDLLAKKSHFAGTSVLSNSLSDIRSSDVGSSIPNSGLSVDERKVRQCAIGGRWKEVEKILQSAALQESVCFEIAMSAIQQNRLDVLEMLDKHPVMNSETLQISVFNLAIALGYWYAIEMFLSKQLTAEVLAGALIAAAVQKNDRVEKRLLDKVREERIPLRPLLCALERKLRQQMMDPELEKDLCNPIKQCLMWMENLNRDQTMTPSTSSPLCDSSFAKSQSEKSSNIKSPLECIKKKFPHKRELSERMRKIFRATANSAPWDVWAFMERGILGRPIYSEDIGRLREHSSFN